VLTVERRLPEDIVADALSESLGLTRVRLDVINIQPEALKLMTPPTARRYVCLPVEVTAKTLTLAMANPQDIYAIDAVRCAADRPVQPVVASRREILRAIERHYAQSAPAADVATRTDVATPADADDAIDLDHDEASQSPEAAAIVAVCHQILFAAVKLDASDVHVEPGPAGVRVRLRIDGMLREYLDLPLWMKRQLLSRLKVLAHLDIAQQRIPQDGRIKARARGWSDRPAGLDAANPVTAKRSCCASLDRRTRHRSSTSACPRINWRSSTRRCTSLRD